jgi:hypothetical protein
MKDGKRSWSVSSRRVASPPTPSHAMADPGAAAASVPAKRPLFRQEVIEFQQAGRQWGRVVPLQPLSTRLMVWCVFLVAAAVIVFLVFAKYARNEVALGYLGCVRE